MTQPNPFNAINPKGTVLIGLQNVELALCILGLEALTAAPGLNPDGKDKAKALMERLSGYLRPIKKELVK